MFQLSLLLDKELVLSSKSFNLAVFDPPAFQKSIKRKTRQMERHVIIPANDGCTAKKLNPCPTLERVATVENTEFVNSSRILRASRWNSFHLGTPNLVESCQQPRSRQKLFIGNSGKLRMICQHMLFPLLQKMERRDLLNLLEKAVNEASQLTK